MFDHNNPICFEILILPQSNLNEIAAVLDPLRAGNRALGTTMFSWEISTPNGEATMTTSDIPIPASRKYQAGSSQPLIIIASYGVLGNDWRKLKQELASEKPSRIMIGIETGAFLLAEAGFLHNCKATTHWEYLEEFEQRFPEVNVVDERYVISEDKTRITTGGAGPTLDLMINMIRFRHGIAIAHSVTTMFVYDAAKIGATSQLNVKSLSGEPLNPRVAETIYIMETHIEDIITIDDLAQMVSISARQLLNLFQKETGYGIKHYYQHLRLQHAAQKLKETNLSILEISQMIGYENASSFSRAFHKKFAILPHKLRNKS